MSTALAGKNEAPSHHGGLENLDEEFNYWIDEVDGEVPQDLKGTFFRNGPGRQKIGGAKYGHWFDGDGMLCAFSFVNGKVHFKNAYVRTPKYLRETESQSIQYRGFGTQIPGGLRKNFLKMPANPANTSIIYHGGHLLALNEGGRPWKLQPDTLDTVGEYTYDGSLNNSNVFSAHGKVHPRTGDYINFGAGISGLGWKGLKTCINIYRINPEGKMINKGLVPLDNFPFAHDFALTDKYAVFFINSIVFGAMGSILLGKNTISDQIHFDNTIPMHVLVVDLETLAVVKRFESTPGAIIHFGNAFESGDEIVIDGMFASDFDANETLADVFNPDSRFNGGTYNRYRLNMTTGVMQCEKVNQNESEFPTFNTRFSGTQSNYCYTACSIANGANSFFNAFQKVSFDGESTLVTLPPGHYGSEPLFAASMNASKEDDGYILEVVYNAFDHLSEVQIFRAADVTDQVCTLKLKHHLPHQFHGYFSEEVFIA